MTKQSNLTPHLESIMNTNANRLLLFSIAAAGALILARIVSAQSVVSEPVGFITTNQLGNSDSFISLPFVRPPAFVGPLQSATGTTITVSGNPWTPNQFVYAAGSQPDHYYVLIGSGGSNPKEGHTYPIISNTANALAVQLGQDNLTGIPANTEFSVIPNWTLATAFPAAYQNVSFTPTTSSASYKTQIRVPDISASGTDLPYTSYFFSNNVDGTSGNVGWRLVGDNTTDHGDDPLLPDSHFVVRNLNGAPTLPLISLGGVLTKKLTTPLQTIMGSAQDNPVSLLRPLDVALNATGLSGAQGSFGANDQLLVFDNAQAGFDKTPSAIYYQDPAAANGPWRLLGDSTTDRGSDVIPAATGFIVRKAAWNGQPAFWTNSFPVQAISAVSRKTHGASGEFDIDLPLSGSMGIECRAGTTHKIVFTFPGPVTFSGASVTSGTASSAIPLATGANEVTVNLSGVTNAQRITVTLLNVNDSKNTNNVAVRMGILTGDTTGNGTVSASDVSLTKLKSGQAVDSSNFRKDVNVDGSINASDVSSVKLKSGTALPAVSP